MDEVKLKFNQDARGIFFIESNGEQLAKIDIDVINSNLVVHEMNARENEDLLYLQLFEALISYAREHYLKIITTNRCVYKKWIDRSDQYADVWDGDAD